METQLLELGWKKDNANLYTHESLGEIYRSQNNGRWYHRQRGQADQLLGRTLKEAIGEAVKIEARLF